MERYQIPSSLSLQLPVITGRTARYAGGLCSSIFACIRAVEVLNGNNIKVKATPVDLTICCYFLFEVEPDTHLL